MVEWPNEDNEVGWKEAGVESRGDEACPPHPRGCLSCTDENGEKRKRSLLSSSSPPPLTSNLQLRVA